MTDKNKTKAKKPAAKSVKPKRAKPAASSAAFPDNDTAIKPDHTSAVARIFVDGLSVFCFNPNKKRAEFGFVRDMHTCVVVNIYKNGCNLFWSTANKKDFPYPSTDNIGIIINSTNTGKMGRRYRNGKQDREDFDYFLDLAWLHHVSHLNVLPGAKEHLTARLDVHDATFYTYQMSRSSVFLSPGSMPLGSIGRILGADIFLKDGEKNLEIKIKTPDGSILPVRLPNDGGKYTITVRTTPTDEVMDHLPLIYKYILEKPVSQPEYSIQFKPPEPVWVFCNDKPAVQTRATKYVCQSFGGGSALPDIP